MGGGGRDGEWGEGHIIATIEGRGRLSFSHINISNYSMHECMCVFVHACVLLELQLFSEPFL